MYVVVIYCVCVCGVIILLDCGLFCVFHFDFALLVGPFNGQTFAVVFAAAMAAALSTSSSTISASNINCISGAVDSNGNRGNVADANTTPISFFVNNPPSSTILNNFVLATFNSAMQTSTQYSNIASSSPSCTNCGNTGGGSSLSAGAIAGIVIGGTIGLCCLIAIVAIFCCGFGSFRTKKTSTNTEEVHEEPQPAHSQLEEEHQDSHDQHSEIENGGRRTTNHSLIILTQS